MGSYSAACRTVFMTAPNASATRSSNPGFPGANGRNASRSSPASSAACNNSSRRIMNASAASWFGKSAVATAQRKSSAEASRASPSTSVRGGRSLYAIVQYLTIVCFSQRNDAPVITAQRVNANVKTQVEHGITDDADFSIIRAAILNIASNSPIQLRRVRQRQPVFGPVLRILLLILLNLHSPQPCPVVVNRRLNGAFK